MDVIKIGYELKKEDVIEEVCTANCGVDVILFCNECHNLGYGN